MGESDLESTKMEQWGWGESDLESTKMEQWVRGRVIWSLLKWSNVGGGK